MRMAKRIIALMIAVMMVTVFAVSTASAAAVVDKFEVIEFGVFNEAGNAPDTIGADKTVTVKATLKRVKGANNTEVKASVIAAVYAGDEMVDVAGSTKTYINYGTTQKNTVQLTIPAGKENLTFKAFLWDGNMITPLAKSSDEAEITGITIGGVEVADFDAATTSYSVNLPHGTDAEPEVLVEANGITNADVTYADGVATITAFNKTYTVAYTIAQPTLTASYSGATDYLGSTTFPLRQTLRAPGTAITEAKDTALLTDIIDISENIPASTDLVPERREAFAGIDDYASRLYTDTWSLIYNVPEELVGKTRVVYDYYNTGGNNGGANGYYWTITVDADTRIWYSSRAWSNLIGDASSFGCSSVTYLGANGVIGGGDDVNVSTSATDYGDDFKFYVGDRTPALTTTMAEVKANLINLTSETNTASSGYHKIYTAELILPEGATSATYIVGGHKPSGKYPSIFCYEFLEEEEVKTALTATATANNINVPLGNIARTPTYVYDEANNNYQLGATLDDSAATIYGNYATRTNAHNYAFIQNCPEEMIGAVGTTWNDNTFGTKSEMGSVDVTLTINRDATLYLDTTDEYATKAGAVAIEPIKVRTAGNGYSAVEGYTFENADGEGSDYHGGRLYKIELDVPEGASSATFVIPVAYYGSEYPFMFIK